MSSPAAASAATLVRRARLDANLSQRELAAMIGTQQPNLAASESGAREPSPELLDRVLAPARLRPSITLELFGGELKALGQRYGVHDLRVFGSVARGSDDERSDVDLLATTDDDVDFLRLAAFRAAAQRLLRFPVDVIIDDKQNPTIAAIRRETVRL